jgi:putative spermidine/putrescine transport system ATP-binding protein
LDGAEDMQAESSDVYRKPRGTGGSHVSLPADLAIDSKRVPPIRGRSEVLGERKSRTLTLSGIRHSFGSVVALVEANLTVEPGQFVVLLGPSGCGKTTLLRIIAGLVTPTAGRLFFDQADVSRLPPEERRVGIVFQNYALFPHMTVFANIAYGLEARRVPRKEIEERVASLLRTVRLESLEGRFPQELSGGQQQRVALARALAIEPNLLLLDEPFGALDKNLRLEMQIEVRRIQRQLGITTVMVTHDQEEALSISDRIAVMNRGRIVQYGTSEEVYDYPADVFVSEFVGVMNLMPAELLTTDGGSAHFRMIDSVEFRALSRGPITRPGPVLIGLRPESLVLAPEGEPGMRGEIRQIVPLGPLTQIHVALCNGRSIVLSTPGRLDRRRYAVGSPVVVVVATDAPCSVFER